MPGRPHVAAGMTHVETEELTALLSLVVVATAAAGLNMALAVGIVPSEQVLVDATLVVMAAVTGPREPVLAMMTTTLSYPTQVRCGGDAGVVMRAVLHGKLRR